MPSEVAGRASFTRVRYAQCWEDADVLLEALAIQPGDTCISIASAGDNSLALLTRDPARVVALDLSEAQLACLELRVAAYRALDHPALLELIGSRSSRRRGDLYLRCRSQLSPSARRFWDANGRAVDRGIGGAGRFERYLDAFRRWVLPLVHGPERVARLLRHREPEARARFYRSTWDTWRWRALFRIFFSRAVMGFGRDPGFFHYVEGSVAERILARADHALGELDPAENPYLQWILTGRHLDALPVALRPESFAAIRDRLDRLEWHHRSLEDHLATEDAGPVQRFNLSDIFEYMSPGAHRALLERLVDAGTPGGRLAYWNLLVPRHRPSDMHDRLRPLTTLAEELHAKDKAFFYTDFVIEEIVG